ncbi:MAG: PorP/SprF family type IX secretion system membrane protein [Bacteroidia bacterium]
MRKLISICLLSAASVVNAQQTSRYSHEFYLPMIYDPAFTGSGDAMMASLVSRAQWIDFKNSPQQNIFLMDGTLPNGKMSLGISLFSDKKGISRKTGGDLYYAYHLKLGEKAGLSLGLSLGVLDHTLFYSEAVIEDPTDPMLVGTSQRETALNANAGLRFNWKGLDLGFAAPQLLGNSVEFQDNTSGSAYYALSRHYLGSLSYHIMISEAKQLSLTPAAVVHFLPNAPLYYDANLNLSWKEKFWIGATYKSEHAIAANAGICLGKKLSVGYSYDIIIGKIGGYSGSSHEVMLSFVFGKEKPAEKNEGKATVSGDNAAADSLRGELEVKDSKIAYEKAKSAELDEQLKKLKQENETLKANQAAGNTSTTPNTTDHATATPADPGKTTTADVTVPKTAGLVKDYVYADNNKKLKTGYYVIVGAYLNKNFAEDELKKLRRSGYRSSKLLYSPEKGYTYVCASVQSSKNDALEKVNKLKSNGMAEVWVLTVDH